MKSGTACTEKTGFVCRPLSSFSTHWSSAMLLFRCKHVTGLHAHMKNLLTRVAFWWTCLYTCVDCAPGGPSWHQRPACWLHLQRFPCACFSTCSSQGLYSFSPSFTPSLSFTTDEEIWYLFQFQMFTYWPYSFVIWLSKKIPVAIEQ